MNDDGNLIKVELEIKLKVPVAPLPASQRADDGNCGNQTLNQRMKMTQG